jgi:succinyl-CoA synthetase beta subunit
MAAHAAWRDRPAGTSPTFTDLDLADARVCTAEVLARAPLGDWARPDELERLLRSVGVEMVPSVEVASAAQAAEVASDLAERFSSRLALKLVSDEIQHKSDVGGVRLHLAPDEVADNFDQMQQAIGAQMQGAVIQPMIDAGPEVIVGLLNDRSFGPVVLFGLGGTATELFSDRAFRLVPLTDLDAHEMVREPRSAALLQGFRGAPPSDLDALENLVLRISTLANGVPELAELDLNPVIARPDGVFIVDGRARITPPTPQSLRDLRRLDSPRLR